MEYLFLHRNAFCPIIHNIPRCSNWEPNIYRVGKPPAPTRYNLRFLLARAAGSPCISLSTFPFGTQAPHGSPAEDALWMGPAHQAPIPEAHSCAELSALALSRWWKPQRGMGGLRWVFLAGIGPGFESSRGRWEVGSPRKTGSCPESCFVRKSVF